MKRSLAIVSLLCLLSACSSAAAQPDTTPVPELYARAVKDLDTGFWFEQAISDLSRAVSADPKNAQCHVALGCAEADRAGSLAYAASMRDTYYNDQAQYVKDFAVWQAAQNDPKNDDFGKPAPQPPPDGLHFRTKDDLTTLSMTGKEAAARAIALGQAAQSEWRTAVTLSSTPKERSTAENVQGWGLHYEQLLLGYSDYIGRSVPNAPKQEDEIAAFSAAVKDDPSNADAWEGLGVCLAYRSWYEVDENQTHTPDATRALQQALILKPENTGLRYKLYQIQTRADPGGALDTLRALAATDPNNSFVQYGLAELLFHQVHYNDVADTALMDMSKEQMVQRREQIVQGLAAKDDDASEAIAGEALSDIEQGNAGTQYEVPEYAPAVPKMIQHAWHYWDRMEQLSGAFSYMAGLRELARAVSGYGRVAASAGDVAHGVEAEQACIGIGLHLAGDWPTRDETPGSGDIIHTLVGVAVAAIGYSSLQFLEKSVGDQAGEQEATSEYAALQQRKAAYIAAVDQALQEDTPHLYDGY